VIFPVEHAHPENAVSCRFQSVLDNWAKGAPVRDSGASGGYGESAYLPLGFAPGRLRDQDGIGVPVSSHALNAEHGGNQSAGPEREAELPW
jgi:hypothetical protein